MTDSQAPQPAHTPGPWEWRGRFLCAQDGMLLWYTTADDGIHAKDADARLIAAAPQMLEALEACLDALQRIEKLHGTTTSAEILAERAIEAATGAQA